MDEAVQRAIREAARAGTFLVPAPPAESLELIEAILASITLEVPNEREDREFTARIHGLGAMTALGRANRRNFHVWTSATNEVRARFGGWLRQAAEVGIKGYRGEQEDSRVCANEACGKKLPLPRHVRWTWEKLPSQLAEVE